jgi:polyisoprenoid-binding protein YceI
MTTQLDTTTVRLPTPGVYKVDPAHSEIGFVARHLIGTKVRGRFTAFDGTFTVADDPERSALEATVDAASIQTGVEMRDNHLRTNDFLDVPTYPTIALKSTGLTKVSDTEWELATELTMRGVTKPVVFDLEYHGTGPGLQPDSEVVGFSASAEIDRRDWGVSFNGVLDGGAIVVGNKVRIELEVEASLQK